MSKKKSQHYVPKFLLRNFSPGRKQVGTYVLASGLRRDNATVDGQCQENYLYGRTPEVEDAFGQMEGRVSAITQPLSSEHLASLGQAGPYITEYVPRLEVQQRMREHPLHVIREFIYYQLHRTIGANERLDEWISEGVKYYLRQDPALQEKFQEDPGLKTYFDGCTITMNESMHLGLYEATATHPVCWDLAVKFLIANPHAPRFIVSDHPVVLRNQLADEDPKLAGRIGARGLVARGLQAYMPLSPDVTIALYDPRVYAYGSIRSLVCGVGAKDVRTLNEAQAMNALECLYFDSRFMHDDELKALAGTWSKRGDVGPRVFEGPIRERSDGRLSSFVQFVGQPTPTERKLSCVRVTKPEAYVYPDFGPVELQPFPVRSPSLIEFADGLRGHMDDRARKEIRERGLPVADEWREWVDGP